jgi:xanthine dehydrogenase accessory factor
VVGRLGAHDVRAPLTGFLRGLVQDGIAVLSGAKIVEVDPRGDPAGVKGVGERPKRIADGVRRAIEERLCEAELILQRGKVGKSAENITGRFDQDR